MKTITRTHQVALDAQAREFGRLSAQLVQVAQERDRLKRQLLAECDRRETELNLIDSIKHGGVRNLLARAHDAGALREIAGCEAQDFARVLLMHDDPLEAERAGNKWMEEAREPEASNG
jgi:hypothetical protein